MCCVEGIGRCSSSRLCGSIYRHRTGHYFSLTELKWMRISTSLGVESVRCLGLGILCMRSIDSSHGDRSGTRMDIMSLAYFCRSCDGIDFGTPRSLMLLRHTWSLRSANIACIYL